MVCRQMSNLELRDQGHFGACQVQAILQTTPGTDARNQLGFDAVAPTAKTDFAGMPLHSNFG